MEILAYKTDAEMQSGLDRLTMAENLIMQLPDTHEGRNTWLLNFGRKKEAIERRRRRNIKFNGHTQAAEGTTR